MGNNLKYEGIRDIVKKIGLDSQKDTGPSEKEVQKDWKRLMSNMRGWS